MLIAVIINFISWPIMQAVIFITDVDFINPINKAILAFGFFVAEAIAYHQFLEISWKKSIIMAFIANGLSFLMGLGLQYLFRQTDIDLPNTMPTHPIMILFS